MFFHIIDNFSLVVLCKKISPENPFHMNFCVLFSPPLWLSCRSVSCEEAQTRNIHSASAILSPTLFPFFFFFSLLLCKNSKCGLDVRTSTDVLKIWRADSLYFNSIQAV